MRENRPSKSEPGRVGLVLHSIREVRPDRKNLKSDGVAGLTGVRHRWETGSSDVAPRCRQGNAIFSSVTRGPGHENWRRG